LGVYTVRVRGIYATALALILSRRGFLLSDVSDLLKKRLGDRVVMTDAPPDVTVKSIDDRPDEVLVIGHPWEAGSKAEEAILETVGYASVRRSKLGLYTVVDAVSIGRCRALLPDGVQAMIDDAECPTEGKVIRATIVREPLEPSGEYLIRRGVRVVGKYIMLHMPGRGVSFSEHVKGEELRASLLSSIIGVVDTSRYHIHFRSASKNARVEEIAREAVKLREKIETVISSRESAEPRVLVRGEYLSIIYVPSPGKEEFDNVRSTVTPTIRHHHTIKAAGKEESRLVDFAEEALKRGSCEVVIGDDILRYIGRNMRRRIMIDHARPIGHRIRLGPFSVDSVSTSGDAIRIMLSRVFSSRGVLDGLGVEKRPGDKAVTTIELGRWHVIHEYVSSDGHLLGVYANINTPPEISFSGVRYLDLYVDVIMRPGEEPEIIDSEELEKAREEHIITEHLYRKAKEEAERVSGILKSLYLQ